MQQAKMQQQISSPHKNPYLTQYKNDISAKQKLIRQRLGVGTSSENNALNESNQYRDKDDIPSIDGESVRQVSHERRVKSQFSYFDDEAEASLQFFKKNLMQSSGQKPLPATSSSFDRQPSAGLISSSRLESTPKTLYSSDDKPKQPQEKFELKVPTSSTARSSNQSNSIRPVPFKQTSLNETRLGKSYTPMKEIRDFSAEPISHHRARHGSPLSMERETDEPIRSIQKVLNNEVPIQRTIRQRSSERRAIPSPVGQPGSRADTRSDRQSIGGRESTESPSQSGTFSRKPLYNSLLRAHDSIRLKVNRPKVRPQSVAVEDTEIDDSIMLADINDQSNPNERAVDVKRSSSRKKNKKKGAKKEDDEEGVRSSEEKLPVRNFSEVRVVKIIRIEGERSLGVTVRAEDGNIVVARIMAGSLVDKQGVLQVGDFILSVNNREVYTPEQLQEELRKTINDDVVVMKIVPSFREELPTLCIYLRALFEYDANKDSLLPCKEVGVSFNPGDILEVVNQEDPNWWQARRVDSENLQTGLIPSQELEERRRAFVIPDYDLATRTSICGTKVSRKSKKKEIYNVGQNSDFDKAELQLYEEVCRTPAFERRTLVLIGANGVGKQALKARLINMDPERFGTPLPHTSRLPREGEEDGVHYHFDTREKMEEDIIDGKYLEYGEYDGALYGTKLDSIREIIGSGKVCVLDCSATCLKILKTSDYLPFVAFIGAPDLDQFRYMHEWARSGNRNYTTFDRALSRQSRRARTLQDFAFDFFEDEDLQLAVEESARLFRVYQNYFDTVLVNNNFERTFEMLRDAIDALSMAPQWIPISWVYGT